MPTSANAGHKNQRMPSTLFPDTMYDFVEICGISAFAVSKRHGLQFAGCRKIPFINSQNSCCMGGLRNEKMKELGKKTTTTKQKKEKGRGFNKVELS